MHLISPWCLARPTTHVCPIHVSETSSLLSLTQSKFHPVVEMQILLSSSALLLLVSTLECKENRARLVFDWWIILPHVLNVLFKSYDLQRALQAAGVLKRNSCNFLLLPRTWDVVGGV